jgi:hypothetical protein
MRGYLIIHSAKELGAKTFVHISFPRHMSYELLSRRRAIMEQACKDLGLKFAFETAPDPTSDVGVAGAQQFILEKVPGLDPEVRQTDRVLLHERRSDRASAQVRSPSTAATSSKPTFRRL